jgi:hydroxymethylpyrimidine pyrophosphatase-like HAD family hydrolase
MRWNSCAPGLGILLQQTMVFAGDSGNDMEVLVSDIPAVLVANAPDAVRAEATARANPDRTVSRALADCSA